MQILDSPFVLVKFSFYVNVPYIFSSIIDEKILRGNDMLKGIQKNVMVVKLAGSSLFESAYFVIRREAREAKHGEMIREANKIICECDGRSRTDSRLMRRWERVMLVLYGALGGGIAVGCVWLGFILLG